MLRICEGRLQLAAAAVGFLFAAGNQHQELVAAPAEHVVRLADVPQQERGDLAQHAVPGLVPERVVDHLEVIDVDEDDRERRLVAAVPLHLAPDDLVEEAAVARAGQRVGDHRLAQVALRRLEPPVRAAQLEGHVLERHQLHAERREQEHDQERQQRLSGNAREGRDPGIDGGEPDQHRADDRRAEQARFTGEAKVGHAGRRHAAGDEQEAGGEHGARAERRRREREPDRDRHQQEPVEPPQPRHPPVRVGGDDEQQPGDDAEELRRPERHRVEPGVAQRLGGERRLRRHREPAPHPPQDVGAPPVDVEKQQEGRDDGGLDRQHQARVYQR